MFHKKFPLAHRSVCYAYGYVQVSIYSIFHLHILVNSFKTLVTRAILLAL